MLLRSQNRSLLRMTDQKSEGTGVETEKNE